MKAGVSGHEICPSKALEQGLVMHGHIACGPFWLDLGNSGLPDIYISIRCCGCHIQSRWKEVGQGWQMNQETLVIGQERKGGDRHKDQRLEVAKNTHYVQIQF